VLLEHGLLTLGETIHGAMMRLYMLERACELELIARQLDEPVVVIDEYVQKKAADRMKRMRPDAGVWAGRLEGDGAHGGAQGGRFPPLSIRGRWRSRVSLSACRSVAGPVVGGGTVLDNIVPGVSLRGMQPRERP